MSTVDEVQNESLSVVGIASVAFGYFCALVSLQQQQSRMHKMGNKIPGPISLPIFGNALLALGVKPEPISSDNNHTGPSPRNCESVGDSCEGMGTRVATATTAAVLNDTRTPFLRAHSDGSSFTTSREEFTSLSLF
ncbi:hypothetical protein EVAR_103759_1 [Eumeta japonica]|uniref:Uncharacterized protein n=1 Tax=Eumeta variegata TaxID=151549 RepID=A0A4C2A896_EUMVA|nr:hypothetical protein EVAR_103759_1 [Eumeta japonica]